MLSQRTPEKVISFDKDIYIIIIYTLKPSNRLE